MKNYIILFIVFSLTLSSIQAQKNDLPDIPQEQTALLIIDVQEFYFPNGMLPLNHPKQTSLQIKRILDIFREKEMEVIHIKHNSSKQAAIHSNVSPEDGEKIITKNEANSFNGTDLETYLKKKNITHLVITGMQTHMCVEGTTRAAYDKGFKCIVPEETATTRDLKYNEHTIKASDVHYSTLSSLKNGYAKVVKLDNLIKTF